MVAGGHRVAAQALGFARRCRQSRPNLGLAYLSRLLDRELDRGGGPELARETGEITIKGLDAHRPMGRSRNHPVAEINSSLMLRHRIILQEITQDDVGVDADHRDVLRLCSLRTTAARTARAISASVAARRRVLRMP